MYLICNENPKVKTVRKRTLFPNSELYLDIKDSCLKGDYLNHFVEHDFHRFDNAEKILLYEYVSYDYDVQQAYQMVKEDSYLFEHKECIILFNVSDGNFLMEDYNKVINTFDKLDLTLMLGIKKKVEILFLCC